MKEIFEVHFDELFLLVVLFLAAGLYLVRPETKDFMLGPVVGAIIMALRGKTRADGNGGVQ